MSPEQRLRYSRHVALPQIGLSGQMKLRAARVLIVGAGGLGSPAALYLAAAGVGTLGLVDGDRVELSNLQRQVLFGTRDVGRPKVEAARERLSALNPDIEVVAHEVELAAANALALIETSDVIVDGTDRIATRYLVNDACVLRRKPLVAAAIHRFEGQAFTYLPGAGPCYRCIFPDAGAGGAPTCADAGVLGVLPGILGALQAAEAIKLILGVGEPLVGRLLTFDALEMRFREFNVTRSAQCAVCGDHPTITSLREDVHAGCEGRMPLSVGRLSPSELESLLDSRDADSPLLQLIDVREPEEFAAGHIAGSFSMPMAELEERICALDRAATSVFICRSGARSLTACALAARAAFTNVAHLEGGLLAWSAEIDPDLPVV